jgi:16S rRNA (cytosine1402-N4)-methyltransferase
MRMDPTRGESAADWLARATVQELTEVIRDYGEERFAFQIAKALVARRAESDRLGPLVSTGELAQIVANVVKTREKGKDPATRTFQAIRIHINQELAELQVVLEAALSLLEQGGRLVVISFHSLEDRIVKTFLADRGDARAGSRHAPEVRHRAPIFQILTKRPLTPDDDEVARNARARSAKLRAAGRTEAAAHQGTPAGLLPHLPALSSVLKGR